MIRNRQRADHSQALTVVIKLGTSSILNEETLQPQLSILSSIAETVCALRKQGHSVVIVSSGAIAYGLKRMGMSKKPKAIPEKQALAAIGQSRLMAVYDSLFSELGQPIAQILLTRNDISDRSRYVNATKTLETLLKTGVVPIVNENDTIAVQEIKFGDNDTLSAITAGMLQADCLFLLTDVDCLYTDNPRRTPTAEQVRVVRDIDALRTKISTTTLGSSLGTGGMETKIIAAELATGAGVSTVITSARRPASIFDILQAPSTAEEPAAEADYPQSSSRLPALELTPSGSEWSTPLHTLFIPTSSPISSRRFWVLYGLAPRGRIIIDQGAYKALFKNAKKHHHHHHSSHYATAEEKMASDEEEGNGGRLLPAGVLAVEGRFAAGQAVRIAVYRSSFSAEGGGAASGSESAAGSSDQLAGLAQKLSTDDEVIEVGRGLSNYNWQEVDRVKRLKSNEIEGVLGYLEREHVVEAITATRQLKSPVLDGAAAADH